MQKKHNLAYLFISHDLKVVRALANEVIVMRNGLAVETGPAAQIFDSPADGVYKSPDSSGLPVEGRPDNVVKQ